MKEPGLVTSENFERNTVLLVDDNEDDTYIFQRAWKTAGINNPLAIVSDGDQAIAYLRGTEPYNDRRQYGFPLIVLLDLNMPRKNGFEFLQWLRQQPALRSMTVDVLTSSMRPQDVQHALELGANSYFVKPGKIDDLVKLLQVWHKNACHRIFVTLGFT
jgi:CheY-like chemotaxis protein